MKKLIPIVLFGAMIVLALQFWNSQPDEENPKRPCVLIVGIDGLRPDSLKAASTPVMDALIAEGAVSYDGFAGGELGGVTEQPTVSGPGWASIFTGVWIDKHKIRDNSFEIHNLRNYPHFFARVKEVKPDAVLASIASWGPIEDHLVAPIAESVDLHLKGEGKDYREKDRWVVDQAVSYLNSANPDILALHLDQVDGAGHGSGFRPDNQKYLESIAAVDSLVGEVRQAIENRKDYANEDWQVIVTTDHGGINKGHGGKTEEERTIFFVASGGEVAKGEVSPGPGHTAVPATAVRHLGLPIDTAWGWSSAFGY